MTPLTEVQLRAIRAGMYAPRYPSDRPLNYDRCQYAVHGRTQCSATATVRHASGFPVCGKHQRAGGVPRFA